MKISEFSVKHSLLINLISLFILIAGFFTLFIYKIRREAFPDVSFDRVSVSTFYPGAAPEEVEKLVTIPIEKELKGVDGIEEMTSSSVVNTSQIQIEISQDIKDKDKVIDDIRDAVDRVRNLPREIEDDPVITEARSGEIPVIQVALSGELSEIELQDTADALEDILEDIPGVSSVSKLGYRDKEVWVEVDPEKLQEIHLSLEEVIEALGKKNINIPAGKLYGGKEFSIRTTGEFHTKEEIENVIIRANEVGNWLRIKDVAEVNFSFEDEDTINKSFGTRSINLTVVKRSTGDAVKIVNLVKEETDSFLKQSSLKLKISYIDDLSYYIKRRLGVLRNNGIIGIFLVCCVLLLFLNYRVALITALGLPIAFSGTIALMAFFDLSINLITMFGLIIVLGMLVDDGIIIAENCSRYLESGLSPKEAAIVGTQEVVKPVTTTIITTVAAFSPLLFMKGMLGKFIWGIPLVVIIALGCSLFEAVVILPSHFADFVRRDNRHKSKKEAHWFKRMVNFYTKLVNKSLNKRYWVLLGLVITLLGTFFLARSMPFVLFKSEEGIEEFHIKAEVPVGTNLYVTNELVAQLEKKIEEIPREELDAYTTRVGSSGDTRRHDSSGKSGSHVAQITVYLTPYTQRKRKVSEIVEYLREKTKDIKGFDQIYFEKESAGPSVGKPISIQLRGEEFSVLEEAANRVSNFLEGLEGVSDINSDYELGRGEIRVVVDEDMAAKTYLSVSQIASSIRNAFKGGVATSIKPIKAEEEINVLVRFPQDYRDDKDTFNKIFIPNKFGNLIPLNKVVRIEDRVALSRIEHLDGKRVVTVRADVDNKNITSLLANQIIRQEFKDIFKDYPGYKIQYGGEQKENARTAKNFMTAIGLALFLIFVILAANFNSLIQPAVVMMAIPFGFIGVIWSFFFHGLSLSFFMMMGAIGLMGIVVNDSIVLVDFINNLRRQGVGRRESIVEAGRLRLRPVLLTTITTALGLVPTAYGIWGGDPFLRPMALTIVWGIVCATALTLIVIPCIYAIIDDATLKVAGHVTVKKSNQQEEKK